MVLGIKISGLAGRRMAFFGPFAKVLYPGTFQGTVQRGFPRNFNILFLFLPFEQNPCLEGQTAT